MNLPILTFLCVVIALALPATLPSQAAEPTPNLDAPPEAPPPAPPVVVRSAPAAPGWPLQPKGTVLYSIGQPTPEEQLYLEYINRSRQDPQAEAQWLATIDDPDVLGAYSFFGVDTNLLISQFATLSPVPPLAFNAQLIAAARGHSLDMFTNVFQGHSGSDGSVLSDRATAAGYNWTSLGENVFATAKSVLHGHAAFNVDWGTGPGGMQSPPGHRLNIHNASFTEIGVGVVLGLNSKTNNGTVSKAGPQVVTQDFGSQSSPKTFVTGVIYYDLNGNQFYDVGEGIGGIRVDVSGSTYYALSANSGGYAVPVSGNGTKTVTFSAGGVTLIQKSAVISNGQSVKVDYTPAYTPPQVSGPAVASVGFANAYTFTAVIGATNYEWEARPLQPLTAVEGAENGTAFVSLQVSPGYDVITTDIHRSGTHSFHFAHPTPPEDQVLTLERVLRPGASAQLQFASRLGWATANQVARVQVSTDDGASWQTIWSQTGTGGAGENNFTIRTVSLAPYAGQSLRVRFMYEFLGGSYFPQTDLGVGWYVDDISFTDTDELGAPTTGQTASPQFTFTPASTGAYLLRVRPELPGHWLSFGPALEVTAANVPPPVSLSMTRGTGQVVIRWPSSQTGYTLQATPQLGAGAAWTNVTATPVVRNNQYEVTLPTTGSTLFFRLRKP